MIGDINIFRRLHNADVASVRLLIPHPSTADRYKVTATFTENFYLTSKTQAEDGPAATGFYFDQTSDAEGAKMLASERLEVLYVGGAVRRFEYDAKTKPMSGALVRWHCRIIENSEDKTEIAA